MRSYRFVLVAILLGAVLVACSPHGDTTRPSVAITAPSADISVGVGEEVAIAGTAQDNRALSRVQLNIGGDVRVAAGTTEWTYAWTPTEVGEYLIKARAYDEAGHQSDDATVTVTVVEVPVAGGVRGVITRTAPDPVVGGDSVPTPEAAPVVPGDVFVVFKQGRPETRFGANATGPATEGGIAFNADGGFSLNGVQFEQARAYPAGTGLSLYRTNETSQAGTRALVDQLRASGAVAEAFPNWILSATAVPDDPFYAYQAWHYEQINMPDAWDIEDGSTDRITVAVLDTGWFPHPDIDWGVGANFVNWNAATGEPAATEGDITNARTNDGNSPHGTHVAGTIGALSNNAEGAAGINWNVELLPIKVLGGTNGSGSLAGILEGAWWALGYDGPEYGGHVNESPARVINMSLGGALFETCPASIDAFYAYFASLGMITVTSAGNEGSPSDINFPASCPSVITVGATGPTGARAYYSNYGAFVDVMAPGGDFDYDHPLTDAFPAGVLSTVYDENGPGFSFMQGTSMAAPHVTGVVSLLLAQDPTLGTEQVREILHNASYPLTYGECNVPSMGFDGQNVCGAGLLDAAAALSGATVTTPTAYAYAVAYEGEDAPELGIGNLSSLELIAANKAVGTPLVNGDYSYEFDALAPGKYLIVGLELRDAATGVSNADRVGFVEEVEVVAGGAEVVDVVVTPIYATLR